MDDVSIRPVAFDDPQAARLMAALDADLVARYDNAEELFPPHVVGDYAPPHGTFLLVERAGRAVGCAGLRPGPAEDVGEVKRMFVEPAERGRGVARRLLARLVQEAAGLGRGRLVLETGTEQPEAMALYASAGWQPIMPYGHYRRSPRSRCYALEL